MSSEMDARWDVYIDDEASCTTPCDRWVDPTRSVTLRSRLMENVKVPQLDSDRGPLHVTAHPMARGRLATGITFVALGGIAVVAGTALTAIGAAGDNGGLRNGGLITLGAGTPVTAGSILLILSALPNGSVAVFDRDLRYVFAHDDYCRARGRLHREIRARKTESGGREACPRRL